MNISIICPAIEHFWTEINFGNQQDCEFIDKAMSRELSRAFLCGRSYYAFVLTVVQMQ